MGRNRPVRKVVKTWQVELHPLDPWYSRALGFVAGVAVTLLVQLCAALLSGL